MATDGFSDDVDPAHRAPLTFPDRPLIPTEPAVFDDREVARLAEQVQRGEKTAEFESMLATHRKTLVDGRYNTASSWLQEVEFKIQLTVPEHRAIIEAQVGEPVFRMWMAAAEWERVKDTVDWTAVPLSDGRIAVWRKRSDLDDILTKNTRLWSSICERIIEDDVV